MVRTNRLRKLIAPLLLAGTLAIAGALTLTDASEPHANQASDTSWRAPGDTSWGMAPADTSWGTPGAPDGPAPSGAPTDGVETADGDTSWG